MLSVWLAYIAVGFLVLVAISTLWIAFDPRIQFCAIFTETEITEERRKT